MTEVAEAVAPAAEEPAKFEFDEGFQTKLAAMSLRDSRFMRMAGHLLEPEYFENVGEAAMVKLGLDFWRKFNAPMADAAIAVEQLKEAVRTKKIRSSEIPMVKDAIRGLYGAKIDLSGAEYVAGVTAEFARNQAIQRALLESVDHLSRRDFKKIDEIMKRAQAVGVKEEEEGYDYWEKITDRTEARLDVASGKVPPRGIPTGWRELDDLLYHKGWGRKELACLLGGAKAGKTTALLTFAKNASLAGYNVLYATLEVGSNIIADRLDAANTETAMKALGSHIHEVRERIESMGAKAGKFKVHEYASGTLRPAQLDALIERYAASGIKFDMIVVDYGDIMAPNHRSEDATENSKSIFIDLRAIGFKHDAAVLTATQTNRDGFKSTVAKAEHVAEDFNKVRTVDIMISISSTEEERAKNEARLFIAASRNTESGFAIRIQQDIARMIFIKRILGRE
jgi:replicative DNA helicase